MVKGIYFLFPINRILPKGFLIRLIHQTHSFETDCPINSNIPYKNNPLKPPFHLLCLGNPLPQEMMSTLLKNPNKIRYFQKITI